MAHFDRSFKFKINDTTWTGALITAEEAIEQDDDGEGFSAMFSPVEKMLFVTEGNITKEDIAHELLHLYVDCLCTNSANLDVKQFEEIIAEFIGHNVEKFIKKRNMLYKKFKKLEEDK